MEIPAVFRTEIIYPICRIVRLYQVLCVSREQRLLVLNQHNVQEGVLQFSGNVLMTTIDCVFPKNEITDGPNSCYGKVIISKCFCKPIVQERSLRYIKDSTQTC